MNQPLGVQMRITGEDILGHFFAEFLDETAFAEFRRIERLLKRLQALDTTVSGNPLLRPADCGAVTHGLSAILAASQSHFRNRDRALTERFEALVSEAHGFVRRLYPGEAMGLLLLHAQVRLFMGNAQGALDLVTYYVERLYAVENNVDHCGQLVELFAQAHLRLGTLGTQPISFIAFGRWLAAKQRGLSAAAAGIRMAPFVAFGQREPVAPFRSMAIRWASRKYLEMLNGRNGFVRRKFAALNGRACRLVLGVCYWSLKKGGRLGNPYSLECNRTGPTLVTRGMGGIGDLLMMEPGLEALAQRQGRRVDFAIQKKFFPIFAHNPHVNILDIDGPPLDFRAFGFWANLSDCPASKYESKTRPRVKRGRVELFARAMRVKRSALARQGWRINHFLSDDDRQFCADFVARHRLGQRPLIGVQPYSRDSYKDHPRVAEIIHALARVGDVLIFHHRDDGLPGGDGIASTAGLALGESLALMSCLDAMVSVDSAFLHAAAAFDVPVTALFGPTGALPLTRHHRHVDILWKREAFGCVPCWRNEDVPCAVTGQLSASPCVAAISTDEVVASVGRMLKVRAG